jgi:hypothetical protein
MGRRTRDYTWFLRMDKHYQEQADTMDTLQTKKPATNTTYKKLTVQWFNEVLCFVSSSVLSDSLVLRNPLLRQAPKSSAQYAIIKLNGND